MTVVRPPLVPEASTPPDPELLIPEARHHQRRRRAVIGLVTTALVVAGVLTYVFVGGSTPTARSSGATHSRSTALTAGAFAGTWRVHTFGVTIKADGRGVFSWPIHTWCGTGPGSGPPPCDSTVPGTAVINGVTTNVEQIINGGHATLRLTSVSSSVAHGVIEGSTDPSQVPNGPATFTVTSTDLLSIKPKATFGPSALRSPLCGPRALALSLSQQIARDINCGA